MAIQKTRGFVLKREDVRETSVLLTAFTRDFGKLKLLSKGVRVPEQKFVGAYELFALDEIVFYEKKKKNVFLLSQCELLDFFPEIRNCFDRIAYAIYFTELADSVTPLSEKSEALYGLLSDSLKLLSSKASPKRVARIFEIKLLSAIGCMPRLKSCASCGAGLRGERARFSIQQGGALCERCLKTDKSARGTLLAGTINFITHIESVPFEKVKHVKVTERVGREVERFLKSFIRYHLDVRLKSMEFIEKVGV